MIKRLFRQIRDTGLPSFAREWVSNPLRVGAAWPSSAVLARAMITPLCEDTPGMIVELGAGTGAVTAALAKRFPADKLIIIERSAALVKHLQQRFPTLNIIQADATELDTVLADIKNISAFVSSLPLRSLPKNVVEKVSQHIDALLQPGGLFIQFTYSLNPAPGHRANHLHHVQSQRIWRNFPPARVEVFRHK